MNKKFKSFFPENGYKYRMFLWHGKPAINFINKKIKSLDFVWEQSDEAEKIFIDRVRLECVKMNECRKKSAAEIYSHA